MIGGVVMAAGMSKRFGDDDKLLARADGESLAKRTSRIVCSSKLDGVAFVFSSQYVCDEIKSGFGGYGSNFVKKIFMITNENPEKGQSESVKLGLSSLIHSGTYDAVFFFASDQPGLRHATVDMMIDYYRLYCDGSFIVVPVSKGKRGSPVLFGSDYFDDLLSLNGDRGGKDIISKNLKSVRHVEVDERELYDVDTKKELIEHEKRK